MLGINFAFRWSLLLGVALFLPVALPAGGGEFFLSELSGFERFNDFLLINSSGLQASPKFDSPVLRTVEIGTPLNVLRKWKDSEGKEWLQVKIASNEIMELSSFVRRGWINS